MTINKPVTVILCFKIPRRLAPIYTGGGSNLMNVGVSGLIWDWLFISCRCYCWWDCVTAPVYQRHLIPSFSTSWCYIFAFCTQNWPFAHRTESYKDCWSSFKRRVKWLFKAVYIPISLCYPSHSYSFMFSARAKGEGVDLRHLVDVSGTWLTFN